MSYDNIDYLNYFYFIKMNLIKWFLYHFNFKYRIKQYNKLISINNNYCILLTMTVNINNNIKLLTIKDSNVRLDIYIITIKKWLYNTNIKIIIVENSGYNFNELEYEKEFFKDRFEIISFNENEIFPEISFDKSKGTHELYSIHYAYNISFLIKNSDFIIKITGRYFIPYLENFISNYDLSNYLILCQFFKNYCEILGCNKLYFNNLFAKKNLNSHIETSYSERINSIKKSKILKCPILKVDTIKQGGTGYIINYI